MVETVKVGAIVYRVMEVERLVASGRKVFGEVEHAACVIRIEATNGPQTKRQTLWHEAIHLILTHAGRTKESNDENLVDALAYGVMGVVQDNPWLAEAVEAGGGEDGGEDAG